MAVALPEYASKVVLPPIVTDPTACLGATDVIESEHPAITELVAKIGPYPRPLFVWVRDNIDYTIAPSLTSRASWAASATLERKNGFCQQKAVLLAAMLRAAKIPAAIDFQHIRDHKLMEPKFAKAIPGGVIAFHGRLKAFIDGAWIVLDPTLEIPLCAGRGYRVTGFGMPLPKTDTVGNPHFDELGTAGPFADLPPSVTEMAVSLAPIWKELEAVKAAL